MRDGWEAEAENWARFARAPGLDHSHQDVNPPALRQLLPAAGRRTLDLGCGEGRLTTILASVLREVRPAGQLAREPADQRWQRIPLFLHLRAVKPGPGYFPARVPG